MTRSSKSLAGCLAAAVALTGCSKTEKAPATPAPPITLGAPKGPTVPKVPFGDQPCQSLTAADEQSLGMPGVTAKADRAPANLPVDNVCSYHNGGNLDAQIGYMAEIDYRSNHDNNHSTSRPDPVDLPGAFYDQQGGLWFTKNGYYVVVAGESRFREAVAHVVAGKL